MDGLGAAVRLLNSFHWTAGSSQTIGMLKLLLYFLGLPLSSVSGGLLIIMISGKRLMDYYQTSGYLGEDNYVPIIR